MTESILVTGGAGFIGSHLVSVLLASGYRVSVVDSLLPQAHGDIVGRPPTLPSDVQFIRADLCDQEQWQSVLKGTDIVVHLAADVGPGQSMYEIVRYVRHNTLATAALWESILKHRDQIRKVVVASSMAVYGEGAYDCRNHGVFYPRFRSMEHLQRQEWEMHCPTCGETGSPAATAEDKPLYPGSIYAITKRDHEEMCLTLGQAYGIPTLALRFFNVYGPGQHLSNPYTGVTAIFCSRLMNGVPPVIFEDGLQSRDLVHIDDIVSAILAAVDAGRTESAVCNVATGRAVTMLDVARLVAKQLGVDTEPLVPGQFRRFDIRHCYADISKAREVLGYKPRVRFEEGVEDLVAWARNVPAVDRVDRAVSELLEKGLME